MSVRGHVKIKPQPPLGFSDVKEENNPEEGQKNKNFKCRDCRRLVLNEVIASNPTSIKEIGEVSQAAYSIGSKSPVGVFSEEGLNHLINTSLTANNHTVANNVGYLLL